MATCLNGRQSNITVDSMFLLGVSLLLLLAPSTNGLADTEVSRLTLPKNSEQQQPSDTGNKLPEAAKQPTPSPENNDDDSDYEDSIDLEDVSVAPTRPSPASIVTAPLPGIPLETVFKAAVSDVSPPCIALKAGIRFTFSYVNASSGKTERGVVDVNARNYSAEGYCSATKQRMSLIFNPNLKSTSSGDDAWNFTISFVRNGSEIYADRLSLDYVVLTGHLPFPWSLDARKTAVLTLPGLFRTPSEGYSYICMSDAGYEGFVVVAENNPSGSKPMPPSGFGSNVATTAGNNTAKLEQVEFYNLQLQAFLPSSTSDGKSPSQVSFSQTVVQCKGDYISIKVPVVLGIILLVFVVAVVVVYMARRIMHGKQMDEKRPADYKPVH